MHTPRIFTTPVMSGYAYSGLSSQEYKDSLCRAITTGLMPYDEFLKVLRECMLELRSTFGALQDVDTVFAASADRMGFIVHCIDAESIKSEGLGEEWLYRLVRHLNDTLYDCATAACNQDVARFIDPDFCRRGVHLQIAKACGILANAIAIVHYFARTVAQTSDSAMGERSASSEYHICAVEALSTSLCVKFSALSRCLNSSPGSEEIKRRKAILRVVRHNMELCCRVAELMDQEIPGIFCNRIRSCLKKIIAAVESSSTECGEMVRGDAVAQSRLGFAKKAMGRFKSISNRCIEGLEGLHVRRARCYLGMLGPVNGALCSLIGTLFLMYRGYASTGNSDHNVAGIIEHCLKILLSFPSTRQNRGAYKARKMYVDMCSVYEDLEQHLGADLLLNPGAEVKLRDAALRYLSEMMEIWEREYGKYFNAVEQTGGSPSQPSTSGMGSTSAGMVGPQASYVPQHDHSYAQPSTSGMGGTGLGSQQASYVPQHDHSYAQPSTSGMGGTGLGSQQASYVPQHDHSYAQPSTSGLGGTAGLGHQQASYVPSHDPGIMPYLWDQPSTSGMGGTGLGSQQASYVPQHDHSYAQPSTSGMGGTGLGSQQASYVPQHDHSYAQPSTSGLGGTAGLGHQQASYVPSHDPGIMPYLWDQPSTSGMGGTGLGSQQASYMPPRDPGIMPHAYAQPSTSYAHPSTSWDQPSTSGLGGTAGLGHQQASYVPSHDPGIMPYLWDQPSTSGMGDASSELEEAQVSSHRSRTPSDDSEPPSKRSRSA